MNLFGVKCKNCLGKGERRLLKSERLGQLLARLAVSILRWLKPKDIGALAGTAQGCLHFCCGQSRRLMVPVWPYNHRTAQLPDPGGVEVLLADDANLISLRHNDDFAAFLVSCTRLRELYCSNNPHLEAAILGKALQAGLEVLDLSQDQLAVNLRLPFKPPQMLEPLMLYLPGTLRVVDLSYNLLQDEHAHLVAETIMEKGNGNLEQLVLRSNYLGNSSGFAMANLLRSDAGARLWRLDMRTNKMEAEGACAMLTALQLHCEMREMRVGYNKHNTKQDLETASLATLLLQQAINTKSLARLELLDLNNVRIGDDGMRAMAMVLGRNTSLRSLFLAFNSLGPCGMEHLARALQNNESLRHLDLRDNDVLDEGAEMLAAGLEENSTLRLLQVARCGIGSKGALFLMTVTRGAKLEVDFGASGTESRKLQGIVNRTTSLANLRFTREAERSCRRATRACTVDLP